MRANDLTTGNVFSKLWQFTVPFFISTFLQTFYGMADLLIIGIYGDASSTTAVSIGSQVIRMVTVIIIGLAMGTTVNIGKSIGAKQYKETSKIIGNTVIVFGILAVIMTLVALVFNSHLLQLLNTPPEAMKEAYDYLLISFIGLIFITSYNVISSIFRGLGDSKSPLYFVGIACIINIILDFLLIGYFYMGALGAALATIIAQAISSVLAAFVLLKKDFDFKINKESFRIDRIVVKNIFTLGLPIAFQDGLIQISFIIITVIANSKGVYVSAGVGVVEKIISFMFLVPSALLASLSAFTAQNVGAGEISRAKNALKYSLYISVSFGFVCFLFCQINPYFLMNLFTNDEIVIEVGQEYLRSYSIDCIFAAIHFCYSGYFCGIGKPFISFLHNLLSILLLRIPIAYFASIMYADTLYPMGLAAPIGSIFSSIVCISYYCYLNKKTSSLY